MTDRNLAQDSKNAAGKWEVDQATGRKIYRPNITPTSDDFDRGLDTAITIGGILLIGGFVIGFIVLFPTMSDQVRAAAGVFIGSIIYMFLRRMMRGGF